MWKDSENSRRHSSAPRACKFARIDPGQEERRGEREKARVRGEDHRRFMENAGAREESQVPTRQRNARNKQQTSKQKPASAVSTAPARARRARRHDFRIPRPVRLRRYVGYSGEKQKECVDVNYTLCFLTRDRTIDFTCANASKYSNKRCYIVDVKLLFRRFIRAIHFLFRKFYLRESLTVPELSTFTVILKWLSKIGFQKIY